MKHLANQQYLVGNTALIGEYSDFYDFLYPGVVTYEKFQGNLSNRVSISTKKVTSNYFKG